MPVRVETSVGLEAIERVSELLQRIHIEDPAAGVWEAADFQWWWRRVRPSDELPQEFWIDERGVVAAALIFTDWTTHWSCDPVVMSSRRDLLEVVWARALERTRELGIGAVEVSVPDDDAEFVGLVESAGFVRGDITVATWRAPDARSVPSWPEGYAVRDRVQRRGLPHHLVRRNGPVVAQRLAETSLYRPDLDLVAEFGEGEVAGYALFWFDPVTTRGFVEPMRTEDAHQGRGLARALLTEGVRRLSRAGATRLRVNCEATNPIAEALYRGAGFIPVRTFTAMTRSRR